MRQGILQVAYYSFVVWNLWSMRFSQTLLYPSFNVTWCVNDITVTKYCNKKKTNTKAAISLGKFSLNVPFGQLCNCQDLRAGVGNLS